MKRLISDDWTGLKSIVWLTTETIDIVFRNRIIAIPYSRLMPCGSNYRPSKVVGGCLLNQPSLCLRWSRQSADASEERRRLSPTSFPFTAQNSVLAQARLFTSALSEIDGVPLYCTVFLRSGDPALYMSKVLLWNEVVDICLGLIPYCTDLNPTCWAPQVNILWYLSIS